MSLPAKREPRNEGRGTGGSLMRSFSSRCVPCSPRSLLPRGGCRVAGQAEGPFVHTLVAAAGVLLPGTRPERDVPGRAAPHRGRVLGNAAAGSGCAPIRGGCGRTQRAGAPRGSPRSPHARERQPCPTAGPGRRGARGHRGGEGAPGGCCGVRAPRREGRGCGVREDGARTGVPAGARAEPVLYSPVFTPHPSLSSATRWGQCPLLQVTASAVATSGGDAEGLLLVLVPVASEVTATSCASCGGAKGQGSQKTVTPAGAADGQRGDPPGQPGVHPTDEQRRDHKGPVSEDQRVKPSPGPVSEEALSLLPSIPIRGSRSSSGMQLQPVVLPSPARDFPSACPYLSI